MENILNFSLCAPFVLIAHGHAFKVQNNSFESKGEHGGKKCLSDHKTWVENYFQRLQYNGVFPAKMLLGMHKTSNHFQSVSVAVV
jgi:hypothetical protein